MEKKRVYYRGEIYYANLNPVIGSEQGGTRPVLVLQNNVGNLHCPTLIVAPLTAKTYKKRLQPTHYLLKDTLGLPGDSMVLLEQIRTIDKQRVVTYVGKVDSNDMRGIEEAMEISLGFSVPAEAEAP